MSKPIKVTDAIMQQIMTEFYDNIMNSKMFDGKISYNKNFKWEKDEKAIVTFAPVAFAKMLQLLYGFSSEVAWHGTVYRDEKQPNRFRVEDIFVYPQLVSGSNVETDQNEYQTWLYALDDEVFDNLRMQGHSHVDFGTTPSTVDTTHQEKILAQIEDDMFYIFMIWNKKMDKFISIYDMANNTLYTTDDVIITIDGAGEDMQAFIDGAKAIVKPKPTATTYHAGVSYSSQPANVPVYKNGAPASRPKSTTPPVGKPGAGYDPGYEEYTGYPRYYN